MQSLAFDTTKYDIFHIFVFFLRISIFTVLFATKPFLIVKKL